jgi:2-polyprenyl-3-methyl-5-hydroxy-6-metoxy-1,4-benzoquinol methylase
MVRKKERFSGSSDKVNAAKGNMDFLSYKANDHSIRKRRAVIKHRGDTQKAENYKGIPFHAANGVHQVVSELLCERLMRGSKVADIGAGHGALSARLHDAGFDVTAFDLDCKDWLAKDVTCHECDINESLDTLIEHGPYQAICAIEVIEHLENPRGFLRDLIESNRTEGTWLVISTPNPLDTFSCIAMFTRGIFNWFSPQHYRGGGHISILPHWLIGEHLEYLGVVDRQWRFLSPFRHPLSWKHIIYRGVSWLRRLASRSGSEAFFEGETALVIVRLDSAGNLSEE